MTCITVQYPNQQSMKMAVVAAPPDAAGASACTDNRLRKLTEEIVADVFDVDALELHASSRGKARIALARQVAMYISHVSYGLTLTEVGQLYKRDRTTVAHACQVIESRRDDREFDEAVTLLDQIVRAIGGPRKRLSAGAFDQTM